MAFDVQKHFPRPTSVLTDNYFTYIVLNTVILIIMVAYALSIPFFFLSGQINQLIFSVLNVFMWAIIWSLNRQGKHLLATIITCIAIYFTAVIQTLNLGWHAGFQYHLLAEMALLLLYPYKNLKVSIIFSALVLFTFLCLYFITLNTDIPRTAFLVRLYTYNAVVSMLALSATILFFRTNTVRLINKLQYTASTDPLTKLFNRRRMNIELDRLCNMAKRYDQSNSLILLDIDHFKKINDKYGHGGGDEILKQFSQLLKDCLRDTDFIARWGGEEFLVLTPFTNIENAALTAEKLRKRVETHTFNAAGQQVHITITCGVAELQADKPIEHALKQADKMLYEGKDNQRNRVMVQKA